MLKRGKSIVVPVVLTALVAGLLWVGLPGLAKPPPPPPPGPAYSLAQLTLPSGFTTSDVTDVNDLGQVVGSVSTATERHAAIWETTAAAATDLDNGFGRSSALAINNHGQVAGGCMIDEFGNGHPMVWIPDGQGGYEMIDLTGGDSNVIDGGADDINDAGMVVGTIWADGSSWGFVVVPVDTNGDGEPDTWFADDGEGNNDLMFTFQVSPEMMHTEANAINDMGWVVGTGDPGWAYNYNEAFLIIPDYTLPNPWFKDEDQDGLNDLVILLLPNGYSAYDVNNQGQIVATGAKLFEVAEDGSYTQTVLPPPTTAYRWTLVSGINDNGQVVGTGKESKPNYDPFLWQKDKGTMRLEGLVSSMAGFSDLTTGNGINNKGQIIGNGTTRAGKRSYLATPVGN